MLVTALEAVGRLRLRRLFRFPLVLAEFAEEAEEQRHEAGWRPNRGSHSANQDGGMAFLQQAECVQIWTKVFVRHPALPACRRSKEPRQWSGRFEAELAGPRGLESIPGVGDMTVDVVISEVGDVRRFRSAKRVSAYAGLAPGQRESAGRSKSLGITKEGSRLLRFTPRRPYACKTKPRGEMKISLRLGLWGYACRRHSFEPGCRLRWGRSTDADGDGDVRRLLLFIPCTTGLTKPSP
jgi:hypothetical protein